jgi:thiol-disulfide isomerase/thioredoxin
MAKPVAAPEFAGIDTWLNSPPLSMQQLRGKVVLVDFWTFDCINCVRTLPYVKAWYDKYKDQGLVVVGVHTPEYPFERKTENVKEAIKRFDIKYPVAQDNRYATWGAYNNQYWPAAYLIDKSGRIVYTHFGEGDYAETEATIKRLLAQPE